MSHNRDSCLEKLPQPPREVVVVRVYPRQHLQQRVQRAVDADERGSGLVLQGLAGVVLLAASGDEAVEQDRDADLEEGPVDNDHVACDEEDRAEVDGGAAAGRDALRRLRCPVRSSTGVRL